MTGKTLALTLAALVAFASNSLLTRLALGVRDVDAATFTAIRLGSGALALALLVRRQARAWPALRGSVLGPLALFAYAAPFSLAYVRIGAAVGALVLFGSVQLTMLGYGIIRGERPSAQAWLGLVLASGGLLALTLPSVSRPDPLGLLLMGVAGVAWGAYSLLGKASQSPLSANARSFFWSSVLALPFVALWGTPLSASARGVTLAVVSGAVTSGIGYAIWYRALPRLTVLQAAVSQLSVPVIAAAGAVVLLREALTLRFMVAGAILLGGVALALSARARRRA